MSLAGLKEVETAAPLYEAVYSVSARALRPEVLQFFSATTVYACIVRAWRLLITSVPHRALFHARGFGRKKETMFSVAVDESLAVHL